MRMNFITSVGQRRYARFALGLYGLLVSIFLIAPVVVIIPLSFNAEAFFTYPMPGLSLRWYDRLINSSDWRLAIQNSILVGAATAAISLLLGLMAALGLVRLRPALTPIVLIVFLAPMLVPVIISGVALYFLFARLGLIDSLAGLILAHTILATPFVVIAVRAALAGFDDTLVRAAASLGAGPVVAFRKVTFPLILPGVVSGALFAFVTSFDEIVVTLFIAGSEQRTLPRQMWAGVREQISPTILAMATILIFVSLVIMLAMEVLRRRATSYRVRAIGR